jgi:predicted AlkP superfamily pyrophosphatase or phosphodiesterase
MINRIFFLLLSIVSFAGLNHAQSVSEVSKPTLVIQIVVEQMRYDMISRYWDSFSDKGFKRLVSQGTFCRNAFYDYMVTESAPGYATLTTGNNPSGHGIISDSWYLRLSGREQYCVDDPRLEDKPGFPDGKKYSPRHLIGSTIGDELRLSNFKQSKVISVSGKPYASVLSSGHIGNAAYWIDLETGNWTSSAYYMDSIPAWVSDFNRKGFVSLYLSREWHTFNPKNTYLESLADNNSYEKGFANKQKTFPYKLSDLSRVEGLKLINYTPFGNTYIIDFAVATILNENLGMDQYADILNISFSTTGYITELFGIRSVELQDIYIRLDRDIAHLLEFIDDRFGKENVLVVLASDRGGADNQQFMNDLGMPTGKFIPAQTNSLLESYLKALYGISGWVKAYSDKQIYLNDLTIDASKTPQGEVQLKAVQFISQFQAVANATTAHVLQTGVQVSGDLLKFRNNYNMSRSGDIFIQLKPGWEEEINPKQGNNSVRSSPYRYDAHVPLIFYGWIIKTKEVNKPCSMTDIAPTISRILNISFPAGTNGQAIEELFTD